MIKRTLSEEITSVFEYIKETICVEHPHAIVNEYAYLLAVLHKDTSLAYQALSSVVMESTIEEMKEFFEYKISYTVNDSDNNESPYKLFDSYITDCDELCDQLNSQKITSSILLLSIMNKHEEISKRLRDFSITSVQLLNRIKNQVGELSTAIVQAPKKHQKKKKGDNLELPQPIKVVTNNGQHNVEIERSLINISKQASLGKIPRVIGYEKYYNDIFTILSKKNRNNVAVCGKSGVGKTSTVKNIANIINDKECNKNFHDKILVEMDFSKLVVGTPYKGAFEQKFYSIVEEAKSNSNYIFFIDNIQLLLNGNSKYAETDIESLLEILLAEPSIQVICTITPKAYSNLQKKSILGKYIQEVEIEEPSIEESIEILNEMKPQYELFHDVRYSDEAITSCVELCKKYISYRALPDSALDLLDVVGAKANMESEENPTLQSLKEELSNIINEIDYIKSSSETKQYDKIDKLTKRQISIKSQIAIIEKEDILTREPIIIDKNHICSVLSKKLEIRLEELTKDDKSNLKGLNDKIKKNVIGQDEAVDEVCQAIKRHKVHLGDSTRPNVLLFLGSTGCGKTLLAKEIAKEVYGNEKKLVRLDMAEYSDKTAVNKITGSSMGYVGYEDKTVLEKALDKSKEFVLLLDEFEKADEQVQNVFLGMFDEGRYTSNHAEEYDLTNLTIILTSNVGAQEASLRGRNIGFRTNDYDMSREVIEKELKKKFKPELLNRIQKISYFNKLNDESLKTIVKLEVSKLSDKIEKLGYHLSSDITETKMIDVIYNEIISKKEYGARPIVNEVQRKIEDNIVDYIIENDIEHGHTFTFDELTNLVF